MYNANVLCTGQLCTSARHCGAHITDCYAGNPFAPGSGGVSSAPPMPSWGTGQDAAAPPAMASSTGFETSPSGGTFVQPKPFEASPGGTQQSSAVAGGALEDDNESCVVCMSAAVNAGFLHGSRLVTQEASCIEPAVYAYTYTYIWILAYVCAHVCMCVCVCVWA